MMMEEAVSSEMEFTDIETAVESFDCSIIFHVVTDVLAFVLFMHQQIPSVLHDISIEYESLQAEFKDLEVVLAQNEVKASLRRQHVGRKREVKQGIRRLDKLMDNFSSLETALQLLITEIPNPEGVILVLGASPLRPIHVYELCFSHGSVVFHGACDFSKSRAAEGLSRKAIRTLISKGAGSDSYEGPTKLFLLVKAPSSFNQPLHFLPKRDFRYNKKIVPLRLRFKCRTQDRDMVAPLRNSQDAYSVNLMDSASDNWIWFQCRHIIKGMASKASSTEE